jgi:hypothetical protein
LKCFCRWGCTEKVCSQRCTVVYRKRKPFGLGACRE